MFDRDDCRTCEIDDGPTNESDEVAIYLLTCINLRDQLPDLCFDLSQLRRLEATLIINNVDLILQVLQPRVEPVPYQLVLMRTVHVAVSTIDHEHIACTLEFSAPRAVS